MKKLGSGIRNKHSGSATLPIRGILGLDPHFGGICGFAYRLPDVADLSINYPTKSEKFLKLVQEYADPDPVCKIKESISIDIYFLQTRIDPFRC